MVGSDAVAQLNAELEGFRQQLADIEQQLKESPDEPIYVELKRDLLEAIAGYEEAIAEEERKAPKVSKQKASPSPDTENVAADSTTLRSSSASFKVHDQVLAKWRGEFYPARITSIVGPVYYVKYQGYDDTAQLRINELKPLETKMQKADTYQGTPKSQASPSPVVQSTSSGTISAAPSVNPGLVNNKRKEPMMATDGAPKPLVPQKKLKGQKELMAKKNNWSDFLKNKKGKGANKDSMFRTGSSVNARVGFTGSGQDMRKDPSKKKHEYEYGDEE